MSAPAPTATLVVPSTAIWRGGLAGAGEAQAAGAELPLAVPAELGGHGAGQSPESLLAAAIAACYAVTLGAVLEAMGLAAEQVVVAAEAQVTRTGRRVAIAGVALRPRVVLAGGATVPPDVFARAERACPVSQALSQGVPITLIPEVDNNTV